MKTLDRILALFLALLLCVSVFPVTALAEDGEEPSGETVQEEAAAPEEESVSEEEPAQQEETAEDAGHVHEYIYVEELPATADDDGMKEHFVCSGCDALFVLTDGEYIEVTAEELVIPKLGAEAVEPPVEEADEEPEEETELEASLAGELPVSGTFGSLSWTISAKGVLTISGSGWIDDSGEGGALWCAYGESILSAVIEDGVYYKIGSYAFSGCSSLTAITIPSGVTAIGDYAFSGCSSLTTVTIPGVTMDAASSAKYDLINLGGGHYALEYKGNSLPAVFRNGTVKLTVSTSLGTANVSLKVTYR